MKTYAIFNVYEKVLDMAELEKQKFCKGAKNAFIISGKVFISKFCLITTQFLKK